MNNFIHPTAVVYPGVEMGYDNHIGPHCTIYAGMTIGNNNHFEGYSSIGSPAEKHGYFLDRSGPKAIIGNNNIFREFTTLNVGTHRQTKISDNCVMLRGSHLSHDSILEDNVIISCNAMIGGESYIMKHSNLGLSCVLHQFSIVGSYSMIGMGAICTKTLDITPGGVYVGNPAKLIKANFIGLKRNNIGSQDLINEHKRWKNIKDGLL